MVPVANHGHKSNPLGKIWLRKQRQRACFFPHAPFGPHDGPCRGRSGRTGENQTPAQRFRDRTHPNQNQSTRCQGPSCSATCSLKRPALRAGEASMTSQQKASPRQVARRSSAATPGAIVFVSHCCGATRASRRLARDANPSLLDEWGGGEDRCEDMLLSSLGVNGEAGEATRACGVKVTRAGTNVHVGVRPISPGSPRRSPT